MPLWKTSSDRAFKHNFKVERKIKPPKQAWAIAKWIQRKARLKGK